jgi:hypothetical protein
LLNVIFYLKKNERAMRMHTVAKCMKEHQTEQKQQNEAFTSYAKDTSPTPGNEPKSFPSLNPINHPMIPTPTDLSASSVQ